MTMATKKKNDEALAALIATGAEALAQQVLDLQDQLTETTEKLRATEATKGNAFPVKKLKGGSYQINGSLRTLAGILTPEQIAADTDLCEELVAKESGLLTKI
jgi:hypothetical protein